MAVIVYGVANEHVRSVTSSARGVYRVAHHGLPLVISAHSCFVWAVQCAAIAVVWHAGMRAGKSSAARSWRMPCISATCAATHHQAGGLASFVLGTTRVICMRMLGADWELILLAPVWTAGCIWLVRCSDLHGGSVEAKQRSVWFCCCLTCAEFGEVCSPLATIQPGNSLDVALDDNDLVFGKLILLVNGCSLTLRTILL